MKKQFLVLSMVFSASAFAESNIVCKAQLPGTGCGQGNVTLNLSPDANAYSLTLDTAVCWGFTSVSQERMESFEKGYPLSHKPAFKLYAQKNPTEVLAEVVLDFPNERTFKTGALLDIVAPELLDSHHLRHRLNLTCEVQQEIEDKCEGLSIIEEAICRGW